MMLSSVTNTVESSDSELMPEDVQAALRNYRQVCSSKPVDGQIAIARAPGRLDVIGGIADYSGSEVLQRPVKEAVISIVHRTDDGMLTLHSTDACQQARSESVRIPLSLFRDGGDCDSLVRAREYFARREVPGWCAYVAGVICALVQECAWQPGEGYSIWLSSSVPEGKGVSSSAAVEVATAGGIVQLDSIEIDRVSLAKLCQRVENEVVGAPCGLMDQMTSVLGTGDSLFALHCVPDRVLEPIALAADFSVWGIDSGVRHAVTGADYTSVRIGAFIGYRLLMEAAGIANSSIPAKDIVDTRWGGYLANVTTSELLYEFSQVLPEHMRGAEFLSRFDAITDTITQVDPEIEYAVRAPTHHPVLERQRVRVFRQLMQGLSLETAEKRRDDMAESMGECLYASHAGYSACGIGSDATDALVNAVRAAGPESGLFGARISGGGSGGTVAIFGHLDATQTVLEIARKHKLETGAGGHVFSGSSDGLRSWQVEEVR